MTNGGVRVSRRVVGASGRRRERRGRSWRASRALGAVVVAGALAKQAVVTGGGTLVAFIAALARRTAGAILELLLANATILSEAGFVDGLNGVVRNSEAGVTSLRTVPLESTLGAASGLEAGTVDDLEVSGNEVGVVGAFDQFVRVTLWVRRVVPVGADRENEIVKDAVETTEDDLPVIALVQGVTGEIEGAAKMGFDDVGYFRKAFIQACFNDEAVELFVGKLCGGITLNNSYVARGFIVVIVGGIDEGSVTLEARNQSADVDLVGESAVAMVTGNRGDLAIMVRRGVRVELDWIIVIITTEVVVVIIIITVNIGVLI